jgi:hypothetical protein
MEKTMYNIAIDWEEASGLIKSVLTDDYNSVCKDIKELQEKDSLDKIDKENLDFNVRIREAMKVVFEYYLTEDERKTLLALD